MSYKHNFSLNDEPIEIKLYTVTVYNLRVCMKVNNPGWSEIFQER